MTKTVQPGTITIPGVGDFAATALPDPFDARDFEYRPRLQPLPAVLERGARGRVMRQDGNSCTGHALATVIDTVLAYREGGGDDETRTRVSPYMLYALARRYDEFEGESDVGSSLRGALKGWFRHGVLLEDQWPELNQYPELDLADKDIAAEALKRPLGAFYRVNPQRLDDMQSALCELNALCVSAVVHDGWAEPVDLKNGLHVIERPPGAQPRGGHAFALVGYNGVGFVVQNSWGTGWGDGGFATLPYEDWLSSAYDAWVCRPGVPGTPPLATTPAATSMTGGALVRGRPVDLRHLAQHVVNLGNEGRLSSTGQFASSPTQIERAFAAMDTFHRGQLAANRTAKRHVLLYAHGGLTSEGGGLSFAQESLGWWLGNGIYPLFFAWQSGPAETLLDQLADLTLARRPFGFELDFREHLDRMVEMVARRSIRGMWNEMKENARAASDALPPAGGDLWPPASLAAERAMMAMPGASLAVLRLRDYVQQHESGNVAVHLVGHSAGAIFLAAMLARLAEAGVQVASMALLAPAITVDEFTRTVLPHLGPRGLVRTFTTFNLGDERELDDVCRAGGIDVYRKSILYLVSRALEGRSPDTETPLLGMQKYIDAPLGPGSEQTLAEAIAQRGGATVAAPSYGPADRRSDASSHQHIARDPLTMTSVVLRALGLDTPRPKSAYLPNTPLDHQS
jgi:hypothetical protein